MNLSVEPKPQVLSRQSCCVFARKDFLYLQRRSSHLLVQGAIRPVRAGEALQSTHIVPRILVRQHLRNVIRSPTASIVGFYLRIPCSCLPQPSHILWGGNILVLEQGVVVERYFWAGIA